MKKSSQKQIRYAVVGLGDIAQGAVLPAFAHASENSRLTTLISDDPRKLELLGRHYGVNNRLRYRDYNIYLRSRDFDAVYIALPNAMHHDFAVRAATAGVHVLCEKPLALNEADCQDIMEACARRGVKLMTAYRLHFERSNLEAIRIVNSGQIGEPRIFNSTFTMQIKPDNIRLDVKMSGGTLYDIGIYCINAARYLFQAEPTEVTALSERSDDPRFRKIDEMTSGVLRFPGGRLASFTTSFGAADSGVYQIIGTKGILKLSQAYGYSDSSEMEVTVGGRTSRRKYPKKDQFAAELIYFSNCILQNQEPEPSGIEGLLDVHIIRSLYTSAKMGHAIRLKPLQRRRRPSLRQEIHRPPPKRPPKVNAAPPSD